MNHKKIALYIRLSDADEDVKKGKSGESNSISAQRRLLLEFVSDRQEFKGQEIKEFFDDGYTGRDFKRPGFLQMMEEAENGKIVCIVVKDFSRLGRDYLEVGNYMEYIFPKLGIRFISVNDGYDSDESFGMTGGMDVAFKNLIYHLYSKDLSQKVKSAIRTRNLRGECTYGMVCYGYKKADEDVHKLVVVPEQAEVVKQIFTLYLSGKSEQAIAKILNDNGVLSPARSRGYTKVGKNFEYILWHGNTITQVLKNEIYTGTLIFHRYETNGNGKNCVELDKSHWIIHENAVEAIISKDDFEEAQEKIALKKTLTYGKRKGVNLFRCAICGYNLQTAQAREPKLYCYRKNVVSECSCSNINPYRREIENTVLKVVKEMVMVIEAEVKRQPNMKTGQEEKNITVILKEMERIKNRKLSLYEIFRDGNLTKEQYLKQKQEDEEKFNKLERDLWDLEAKKKAKEVECEKIQNEAAEISKAGKLDKFDADALSRVIESIIVYPDNHIEIVWKSDDIFKEIAL